MNNQQYPYQPYRQPAAPSSYFDGGLLGLIGINIGMVLITVFTLGLAYPWAVCMREQWYARHTVVDGRRLRFDGTGGQLFGKYIVWMLLTVITFGIYSFWLSIRMKQWIVKHTHFVG